MESNNRIRLIDPVSIKNNIVIFLLFGLINISCSDYSPYLSMSYKEFDQTGDKGWREFSTTGLKDYKKAAAIIEYYLNNKKDLGKDEISVLHFHAGQIYANDNNYSKALKHFSLSFESETDINGKYWNNYVRATIAFLNKDIDSLKKIKSLMSELPEINGMHTNLAFVRSFIRNIDKPYSFAYMDVVNNQDYKD